MSLFSATAVLATEAEATSQSVNQKQSVQLNERLSFDKNLKEKWGLTYFSYFFGPGLHPENLSFNPNQIGNPGNDGLYFQNQISVRYKFSTRLALDFQSRFNVILNNSTQNAGFSPVRWETPRIGISGNLLNGEDWALKGAINTDFPYFFPAPFTGYQAQQRKVILTPGMFAGFSYLPKRSRWSIFSVVSPRYFIYADRDIAEPQFYTSGFSVGNKSELLLAFQPTLNYQISEKTSFTFGTSIDYRKQVISNWNPFDVSLLSNGESKAWRLYAIPIYLGFTHKVSPAFSIFPYLATYPIAIQRTNARNGNQSTLLQTTSIGMWLSGTLF